jgi:hypothetical protein
LLDRSGRDHLEHRTWRRFDSAGKGGGEAFGADDPLEVGAGRDSDYVYGPRLPRTFFVRINARL